MNTYAELHEKSYNSAVARETTGACARRPSHEEEDEECRVEYGSTCCRWTLVTKWKEDHSTAMSDNSRMLPADGGTDGGGAVAGDDANETGGAAGHGRTGDTDDHCVINILEDESDVTRVPDNGSDTDKQVSGDPLATKTKEVSNPDLLAPTVLTGSAGGELIKTETPEGTSKSNLDRIALEEMKRSYDSLRLSGGVVTIASKEEGYIQDDGVMRLKMVDGRTLEVVDRDTMDNRFYGVLTAAQRAYFNSFDDATKNRMDIPSRRHFEKAVADQRALKDVEKYYFDTFKKTDALDDRLVNNVNPGPLRPSYAELAVYLEKKEEMDRVEPDWDRNPFFTREAVKQRLALVKKEDVIKNPKEDRDGDVEMTSPEAEKNKKMEAIANIETVEELERYRDQLDEQELALNSDQSDLKVIEGHIDKAIEATEKLEQRHLHGGGTTSNKRTARIVRHDVTEEEVSLCRQVVQDQWMRYSALPRGKRKSEEDHLKDLWAEYIAVSKACPSVDLFKGKVVIDVSRSVEENEEKVRKSNQAKIEEAESAKREEEMSAIRRRRFRRQHGLDGVESLQSLTSLAGDLRERVENLYRESCETSMETNKLAYQCKKKPDHFNVAGTADKVHDLLEIQVQQQRNNLTCLEILEDHVRLTQEDQAEKEEIRRRKEQNKAAMRQASSKSRHSEFTCDDCGGVPPKKFFEMYFHGGSQSDWPSFRKTFSCWSRVLRHDQQEAKSMLLTCMTGMALGAVFTVDHEDEDQSLEDVLEIYEQRLYPARASLEASTWYEGAVQQPKETIQQFHGRLQNLWERAYPSLTHPETEESTSLQGERELIRKFAQGLSHPVIRLHVLREDPTTYSAAWETAKKEEVIQKIPSMADHLAFVRKQREEDERKEAEGREEFQVCVYCKASSHSKEDCWRKKRHSVMAPEKRGERTPPRNSTPTAVPGEAAASAEEAASVCTELLFDTVGWSA